MQAGARPAARSGARSLRAHLLALTVLRGLLAFLAPSLLAALGAPPDPADVVPQSPRVARQAPVHGFVGDHGPDEPADVSTAAPQAETGLPPRIGSGREPASRNCRPAVSAIQSAIDDEREHSPADGGQDTNPGEQSWVHAGENAGPLSLGPHVVPRTVRGSSCITDAVTPAIRSSLAVQTSTSPAYEHRRAPEMKGDLDTCRQAA